MSNTHILVAMPITPPKNFERDIAAELAEHNRQMHEAIIDNLNYIGIQGVNIARTHRRYSDRSGNLTSSIGYIIFDDGRVVKEGDFNTVMGGAEGSTTGRAFAHSAASEFPTGIALVDVAGMNYAAYVERRGLGGMTTAEIYSRNAVQSLLQKLTT